MKFKYSYIFIRSTLSHEILESCSLSNSPNIWKTLARHAIRHWRYLKNNLAQPSLNHGVLNRLVKELVGSVQVLVRKQLHSGGNGKI
jgi:hypothetical protein